VLLKDAAFPRPLPGAARGVVKNADRVHGAEQEEDSFGPRSASLSKRKAWKQSSEVEVASQACRKP